MVLFLVFTLALSREAPTGIAPAAIAGGLLVLGMVALYVYHRLRWRGHFERFAARVRPVGRASRLLIHPWGPALLGLTLLVWMLEGTVFWLSARAVSVDLSFAESTQAVVIASFFALVPAAPSFLGTWDAAVIFSLKAFGLTGGQAIAVDVMERFVVFVPITVVGLLLVITRYGGLNVLRRRRRESRADGQPVLAAREAA